MQHTVIDVSRWQGKIDWARVKASGVWGAIIKAGGSDAGFYTDPRWEENYRNAKANGIAVGAYYFVGPGCKSYADGAADAKRFLALLAGKTFDLPVYIDYEAPDATNKAGNTQACIGFGDVIETAGYYCGVYASDISGFQNRLNKNDLKRFTWWVARYGGKPTYATENCHIWQYTSSGHVGGISGNVDMDICYQDFPSIIKGAKTAKPKVTIKAEAYGVFRLYSGSDHVYTADIKEAQKLADKGWKYEGVAWHWTGKTPVNRLYDGKTHLFTTDKREIDTLKAKGWKVETESAFGCETERKGDTVPVYRLHNKVSGEHNLTTDATERDKLVKAGWILEGVAFYARR